ncbi:MAG TPA: nitrate reductase associated protein [Chitinophagaceae bacterium]|nr:nitrate reductase associated protein [Chitinophagaceae bacterium]
MINNYALAPNQHTEALPQYHTEIVFFKFEEDFVEDNIRCIPMIVRFKLDACGIKLKLQQWAMMNDAEKETLSFMPCATPLQVAFFRQTVVALIAAQDGGSAVTLPVEAFPAWANLRRLPQELVVKLEALELTLSLQQWQQLTNLQRFVLLKLCRPGHENRNFPIAFKEFGLA